MPKYCMTDESVEREIARLKTSPHVALANEVDLFRLRRRELLFELQAQERRGRQLARAGITQEMLRGYQDDYP